MVEPANPLPLLEGHGEGEAWLISPLAGQASPPPFGSTSRFND
jgi:hypothetical protein